jgi:hypothetical protein
MLTEALHGRHERIMQVGAKRSLPELRKATFEAHPPVEPAGNGNEAGNIPPQGPKAIPDYRVN